MLFEHATAWRACVWRRTRCARTLLNWLKKMKGGGICASLILCCRLTGHGSRSLLGPVGRTRRGVGVARLVCDRWKRPSFKTVPLRTFASVVAGATWIDHSTLSIPTENLGCARPTLSLSTVIEKLLRNATRSSGANEATHQAKRDLSPCRVRFRPCFGHASRTLTLTHTHTCVHTHIHTQTRMNACTCTHTHTHVHTHAHAHTHAYTHAHTHTYVNKTPNLLHKVLMMSIKKK
jgi:hypothetical protein